MNYVKTIKKFISGTNYAGDSIQTSDGTIAYVTDTGISKPYTSMDIYNATANKRGCKSTPVQLEPTWANLGFPVGSMMESGQSCGNEGKYVQSTPPKNDFDWQFYLSSNADLTSAGLTTEQQAIDHWNTNGKSEGRLPNATIMKSMSSMGNVGYVDLDTQIHNIPFTYTGTYSSFLLHSNVTGTDMEDCTPIIKYGDQLFITANSLFGSMNSSTSLEFGSTKTGFFIRPVVGQTIQNLPVKYGDKVSFTSSSDTSTSCGWWGCKVGTVNPETLLYEFGPGGDSGGTTLTLNPPSGSSYAVGSDIKYGNMVSMVAAVIPSDDTLKQGDVLLPGNNLRSSNGSFIFSYQVDGNLCIYNIDGTLVWQSNKLHTPNKFTMQSDGNLVAYNINNAPAFSIPMPTHQEYAHPNIPFNFSKKTVTNPAIDNYRFVIQNDGNAVVYNGNNSVSWASNTSNGASLDGTFAPLVAYIKNNILQFNTSSKQTFSFLPMNLSTKCRISDLQSTCNQSDCTGFVHSSQNNTWQMSNSSSSFAISNNSSDIYVKDAMVQLQDSSCSNGKASMINSDLFANYVHGDDFTDEGPNQCNILNMAPITSKEAKYEKNASHIVKIGNKMVQAYNPSNVAKLRNENNKMEKNLHTKASDFQRITKQINHLKKADVGTYNQQKDDMEIFNTQNKMHAIAWGILATTLIIVVVVRYNK